MRRMLTTFKYLLILLTSIYPFTSYADGVGEIWYESRRPGVSPVEFLKYNDLCGSCHFPYQPGLLPSLSWERVMLSTDNHFGEKLTLSPVELRTITRYLLDNSAGHLNDDISLKILRSMRSDPAVMQITKTPYFVSTHSKVDNSTKMKGMGQCDSCHQGARQGKY